MKRVLKFFLSIITVLCITCFTVMIDYQNAYAVGLSDLDFFYNLVTNDDAPYSMYREAIYKSITQDMGIILGPLTQWQIENERKIVAKYIKKKYGTTKTEEQVTDSDIQEFYNDYRQNITVNMDNHSLTYNNNSKTVLDSVVDVYKEESTISNGYPFDLQQSYFNWGDDILPYAAILDNYQGYIPILYKDKGVLTVSFIKQYSNTYGVITNRSDGYTIINLYQGKTVNGVSSTDLYVAKDSSEYKYFRFENNTWVEHTSDITFPYSLGDTKFMVSSEPELGCNSSLTNWAKTVTKDLNFNIPIFSSKTVLDNYIVNVGVGKSSYYIDNRVYNNYKNSSGDYTVNTDNSNRATYNDINTYIDDHHRETGDYPTLPDIEIYIETENTPTPTPTPTLNPGGGSNPGTTSSNEVYGGASASATANNGGVNVTNNNNPVINFVFGGSDTVSGNGSGTVSGNSSGGSGINFGFLGSLGSTLKSLIENIGKAIVDVITGITTVLAEVIENVPKVFGDFIGAILNWLPPELQALISLSVVAMVTYGIIKLIRG